MARRFSLMAYGICSLRRFGGGVFFTAGIADEEHGLFGIITENP